MKQGNSHINREQATAIDFVRPPARSLMHDDAVQVLALLRALCKKYGVDGAWGWSFKRAVLGRPPLAKKPVLPVEVEESALTGERLVDDPGPHLRGLLIGIERGMHHLEAGA